MAEGEKPYRLYKGGRSKGKVPGQIRQAPAPRGAGRDRGAPRPRRPRWGRRVGLALVLFVLLTVGWVVASYLSFRGGVSDANARLP